MSHAAPRTTFFGHAHLILPKTPPFCPSIYGGKCNRPEAEGYLLSQKPKSVGQADDLLFLELPEERQHIWNLPAR